MHLTVDKKHVTAPLRFCVLCNIHVICTALTRQDGRLGEAVCRPAGFVTNLTHFMLCGVPAISLLFKKIILKICLTLLKWLNRGIIDESVANLQLI